MTQVANFEPIGIASWRSRLGYLRERAHGSWREAPPRFRTGVQLAALLLAVAIAYNYTLSTLIQNAGLETPLAYVSLVPAIALALAAVRARPLRPEPAIHDRQVDYIVGLPLIGVAFAANVLLPHKLSAMFWVWRIDLLTLPVFVAGAVAIIFGVRVLWRQKLAVGYLFLAWPYPYESVLLRVLDAFTAATLFATKEMVKLVPVAKSVPSPDGTLFVVAHHGTTFPLSIVTACSGVNSVVGFLLVGSAFAAVVRGPLVRKVLWLVGGMALLWAINIGRILFIFWAGKTWGEHIAVDVLHPFIGLLTFSVGVLAMIALIRPLGMHVGVAWQERAGAASHTGGRSNAALAVPRIYTALIIVTVVGVVLGLSNLGLKSYNLVADASGRPKLTAFVLAPAAPAGWRTRRIATFDWARPLFGDTSIWNRYIFGHLEGGNLATSMPVVGDVIVTPDLSSFSAYGVEACYQFHGYSLRDVAQVNVGGGVTGQAMSYDSKVYGSWSIVYWIIPVRAETSTEYERVVLYVRNTGKPVVVPNAAAISGIANVAGRLDAGNRTDAELIANRSFLVAFARELTRAEVGKHPIAPSGTNTTPTLVQHTGTSGTNSGTVGSTAGTSGTSPATTKGPTVDPWVSLSPS